MNILLTGATGYIGSHIAQSLVLSGHKLYATCREKSVYDKCTRFVNHVLWLNQDKEDWKKGLENIEIDLLIHSAWDGISAENRNNWNVQLTNFQFSKAIIDFSLQLKVKRIVCLGSQAEYGEFNYKVTENEIPYPLDAYGAVKLMTLFYLRSLAINRNIEWYWLRVFSIIGENENESWLLPQVISKLLKGDSINLTEGKQCYDYLYIEDFILRINKVINNPINNSGVYNICSGRAVEIKQLLMLIADKLNVPDSLMKFGVIPYRANQNMLTIGSPDKFEDTFGSLYYASLDDTVSKIISFYKNKEK